MSPCVFTEVTPPAVTLFCLRFFLQGTCLIVGCGLYPAALHGRAMARSGRAPGALPAADGRPPAPRLPQSGEGGIQAVAGTQRFEHPTQLHAKPASSKTKALDTRSRLVPDFGPHGSGTRLRPRQGRRAQR